MIKYMLTQLNPFTMDRMQHNVNFLGGVQLVWDFLLDWLSYPICSTIYS